MSDSDFMEVNTPLINSSASACTQYGAEGSISIVGLYMDKLFNALLSQPLLFSWPTAKLKNKDFLGHSDIAPCRKKDPGEKFPWELLSKYHIGVWHSLDKKIIKSYRQKNINSFEKRLFLNYLIKIGYFFKKKNTNSILSVVKAFQRRFRPNLINGKIDLECLKIAKNLVKSGFN